MYLLSLPAWNALLHGSSARSESDLAIIQSSCPRSVYVLLYQRSAMHVRAEGGFRVAAIPAGAMCATATMRCWSHSVGLSAETGKQARSLRANELC